MALDLFLTLLVLVAPLLVLLIPSLGVTALLNPSPRIIYLFHHHRLRIFALAYAGLLALALRWALGSSGGAWTVVAGAGLALFTLAFLALYPARVMDPLRRPGYISAEEADRLLSPEEDVVGVITGGRPRAYSLATLIRPHAALDQLGPEPLVVTYCSLSRTANAFAAGTAGSPPLELATVTAIDNNVAFYDAGSGSLIQQIEGRFVCGPATGRRLATVPVVTAPWRVWRQLYPDTLVCHTPPSSPFDRLVRWQMLKVHYQVPTLDRPFHPVQRSLDPRLPPMTPVLGVEVGGVARAYRRQPLSRARVRHDRLGGEEIVLLLDPERDLAAAYAVRLGDEPLTLEPSGGPGLARDRQTGSDWDVTGRAVAGPRAGSYLEPVFHYDKVLWFSWAMAWPQTELVGAGEEEESAAVGSKNVA